MDLFNELELMAEKRDFIQKTDEQILHLIEQRIEAAKVIGDIKKKMVNQFMLQMWKKQKLKSFLL